MLLIKMSSVFSQMQEIKIEKKIMLFLATQSTDVEYLQRQLIIMLMASLDTDN